MAYTGLEDTDFRDPPKPNISRRQQAFAIFTGEVYGGFVFLLLLVFFLTLALALKVNWFVALVVITLIGIPAGLALRNKFLYFTILFWQFVFVTVIGLSLQAFGAI